jgi:hypothetical protein
MAIEKIRKTAGKCSIPEIMPPSQITHGEKLRGHLVTFSEKQVPKNDS